MLEELQDHAASPSDPIGTQVEMSAGASTSVAQEKEEEHDEAFLRLEALVARSYAGYLSGAGRHDLSERPVAAPDGLTAAAPGCLTAAPGGLTAVAPGVPPLEERISMSVYSNVRKILERLVGDPSNGKLHRMRRDVMIRVCGNSETILRTIVEPLFTYCGFLVHDDRFELDSALLVDEAVFLQQQFSMPDSLNGCLISCGRDSKVAPTQDVIEDATDVKEENSTTGGTTTSSTGGTTTSSTGGTTTSSGFIVLASAPKVQKVIRLMKTAELACKGPESLSLMEVMEAVREGVKIPGIIKPTEDEEDTTEDHTNRETPSQLVEIDERPRKPWEK